MVYKLFFLGILFSSTWYSAISWVETDFELGINFFPYQSISEYLLFFFVHEVGTFRHLCFPFIFFLDFGWGRVELKIQY